MTALYFSILQQTFLFFQKDKNEQKRTKNDKNEQKLSKIAKNCKKILKKILKKFCEILLKHCKI